MYVLIALALGSMVLKTWVRSGGLNSEIPIVNPRFDKVYKPPLGPPRFDTLDPPDVPGCSGMESLPPWTLTRNILTGLVIHVSLWTLRRADSL